MREEDESNIRDGWADTEDKYRGDNIDIVWYEAARDLLAALATANEENKNLANACQNVIEERDEYLVRAEKAEEREVSALDLLVAANRKLSACDKKIAFRDEMIEERNIDIATAERERDEAIAECDRYKMALKKYGNCLGNCWTERAFDAPCDCGFGEALKGGGE